MFRRRHSTGHSERDFSTETPSDSKILHCTLDKQDTADPTILVEFPSELFPSFEIHRHNNSHFRNIPASEINFERPFLQSKATGTQIKQYRRHLKKKAPYLPWENLILMCDDFEAESGIKLGTASVPAPTDLLSRGTGKPFWRRS